MCMVLEHAFSTDVPCTNIPKNDVARDHVDVRIVFLALFTHASGL